MPPRPHAPTGHTIQTIRVTEEGVEECRQHVIEKQSAFSVGARRRSSHVYEDGDERLAMQWENDLTGMLGAWALSVYLFGTPDAFHESRRQAMKNPYRGDGGSDVAGFRIDVKASLIRNPKGNILHERHLAIAGPELKRDVLYVSAVVDRIRGELYYDTKLRRAVPGPYVALIGWARYEDMPKEPNEGFLQGAHVLRNDRTRPLPIPEEVMEEFAL